MCASLLNRPPDLSFSRPRLVRTQPPPHRSWSSYDRGYPTPGRVSTLLNQTYSTPVRLVHACLQVTEHVWHPMHLSRFITIDICAMTFMREPPSVRHVLRATPDRRDLVALVARRAEVVEGEGQL